jgi:hypothetical protein
VGGCVSGAHVAGWSLALSLRRAGVMALPAFPSAQQAQISVCLEYMED